MIDKLSSTKLSISLIFVLVSTVFITTGSVFAQPTSSNESTQTNQNTGEGSKTATTSEHHENNTNESSQGTVVRDAQTILLEGHTLPKGDYIHLYDTTPYQILSGHVALKVPCHDDNSTDVNVLIGQAPQFKVADPEFISELSKPGDMCLYHVDVPSESGGIVTDIAIKNNGSSIIHFPATSTVVIGIDKISPLPEGMEH